MSIRRLRWFRLSGLFAFCLASVLPVAAARPKTVPAARQSLKAQKIQPTSSTAVAAQPAGLAPDSAPPPVDGSALATPAPNASTEQASPATVALLRAIEKKNAGLKTVHAVFDQTRYDEVYLEKAQSRGELWFVKPGSLRVDYSNPKPMITLVADNTLYSYVPDLKQVNYLKFESDAEREAQLHHYLLGFGFKTEELLRHYGIQSSEAGGELSRSLAKEKIDPAKTALVEIKPRPEYAEATPFTRMQIWFDKASLLPRKIWYKEASGADITLEMGKIEFDQSFANDQFNVKAVIPPDAEYINQREKAQ